MNAGSRVASETVSVLNANILTPYLRVRFSATNERLLVEDHRSLLGLIPAGHRRLEFPLARIGAIGVRTKTRIETTVAVLALGTLIAFGHLPPAAIVPIGALIVWLTPLTVIKTVRIEDTDGGRWSVPICWFHTFDAELIAADVEARKAA